MKGIDLNKPITYKYSSLRYFDKNEHHVTRFCEDDVLVLVFRGVLRFTEGDESYEVYPGQYHIQRHNMYQKGEVASDSPEYLFVHFRAEWTDGEAALAYRGNFDYSIMKPIMDELDEMCHKNDALIQQTANFFRILSILYQVKPQMTIAGRMEAYISEYYQNGLSLEMLSEEFHFSKNHIINLFKQEYGMTPFEYVTHLKITRAKWLLEVTPKTVESIACECGFGDYSHFYKVFRKATQISPLEWRRQKRLRPVGGPL